MFTTLLLSPYLYFEQSILIQPGNYQVSKEVVHELEFGDIAVMQI